MPDSVTMQQIRRALENDRTIDIITIASQLESMGILEEVGGYDCLRDISNTVPSCANYETYINEVQKHGRARRLIGVCSNVVGKLFDTDNDVNEVVSHAESEIIKVSNEGTVRAVTYVRDCVDAATDGIIRIELPTFLRKSFM